MPNRAHHLKRAYHLTKRKSAFRLRPQPRSERLKPRVGKSKARKFGDPTYATTPHVASADYVLAGEGDMLIWMS